MGKVFTSEDYIKLKEANNGSTDLVIPEGYDKIGTNAFHHGNITTIEIPSTVKIIGSRAFDGRFELNQVKFVKNSGLKEIGAGAFLGAALKTIEFPPTVKKIDRYAFAACHQLQQVRFAEDSMLEELGDFVFYNAALTEIVLPTSVQRMSNKTFAGSKLKKVSFGEDAIIYYDSNGNVEHLIIHTRNKDLAILLIGINESCESLVIKYKNYQELNELIQLLNKNKGIYKNITLIGKKLSTTEKWNIESSINKVIGDNKTTIIFEESKVTQENKSTIVDGDIMFSKQNEGLLGRIKNLMFNPNSLPLLESVEKNLAVVSNDNQQLQAQGINFPDIMYFTSQITELCVYITRESDKLIPSMKELIRNQLKDIFDYFASEVSYLGEEAVIKLYNRLEGLKLALDSQLSTTNEIQSESKSIK